MPIKIILNQTFERLTVKAQYLDGEGKKRRSRVICECSCGSEKIIDIEATSLMSGNTQSCGCLQKERASEAAKKQDNTHNYIGNIYDRLEVINQYVKEDKMGGKHSWCICNCKCGTKDFHVRAASLQSLDTKSCGCLQIENGKKYSVNVAGKPHTLESRQKLSKKAKQRVDDGIHNFLIHGEWKHTRSERQSAYQSPEYKHWRSQVFDRDNYTCQFCGKIGGKLESDHILPWCTHPESRYGINNGRTLCRDCHIETDTYGGKMNKILKQLKNGGLT